MAYVGVVSGNGKNRTLRSREWAQQTELVRADFGVAASEVVVRQVGYKNAKISHRPCLTVKFRLLINTFDKQFRGFLAFGQALPPAPSASASIEVIIRSEPKNAWLEPASCVGLFGALGGIIGVFVQRYWHRSDEERALARNAEVRMTTCPNTAQKL